MAPVDGKSAERVRYKLYGVLYHHGESASSGHYSVDVLRPNEDSGSGEAWLRIDDEAVSPVPHQEVFMGHVDDWGNDRRCAYMLFYSRIASAQTSSESASFLENDWRAPLRPKKKKKKSCARRLIALHKKFK